MRLPCFESFPKFFPCVCCFVLADDLFTNVCCLCMIRKYLSHLNTLMYFISGSMNRLWNSAREDNL